MEDFFFNSGSVLQLNRGDKSSVTRNITIQIENDGLIEADEYFVLALEVLSPLVSLSNNVTATVTILSEDGKDG